MAAAKLDAATYFQVMENTVRTDPKSPWLELFCQRAMGMGNFSTRNVALILTQLPNATFVAGRSQFKERGVYVAPGATPIYITAPKADKAQLKTGSFSWAVVYDISQTTAPSPRRKQFESTDCLKRAARLARQAGIKIMTADLADGAWKVLDGTNLYIRNGASKEMMCQLIFHELAYWALVKDGAPQNRAYSLAAIASYSVGVGLGLTMPLLSHPHKLVACEGLGLLSNVDSSLKVAKRLLKALKNL